MEDVMGAIKRYYHDELMLQQEQHPLDQQMSEAEIEDYLDRLYDEWITTQEAYRYEDNYKPFERNLTKLEKEMRDAP
jgi:hypothetical protein